MFLILMLSIYIKTIFKIHLFQRDKVKTKNEILFPKDEKKMGPNTEPWELHWLNQLSIFHLFTRAVDFL